MYYLSETHLPNLLNEDNTYLLCFQEELKIFIFVKVVRVLLYLC